MLLSRERSHRSARRGALGRLRVCGSVPAQRPAPAPRRARRGVALLAALTMLVLSAALLTGAFAASRAMIRSARSAKAMARVETGAQRALAEVLVGWSPALDSLSVGGIVDAALDSEPAEMRPLLSRRAQVRRITERLYVISLDVRAFDWDAPIAQRRARLIVERPAQTDSAAPLARPIPVRRWSVADLY
jgi:hypothetical protein